MENLENVMEAILFALGREITTEELAKTLEINEEEIIKSVDNLKNRYTENNGVKLIDINGMIQLVTNNKYYEQVNKFVENAKRQNLSISAQETLAIIAYNPKITRAEIEAIRGVAVDATIYKLLEYNLIEEAGRLDAPGRPTTYKTNNNFLKMFGFTSLEELPQLPKYKMDENQQIVIDDIIEEKTNEEESNKEIDEQKEEGED